MTVAVRQNKFTVDFFCDSHGNKPAADFIKNMKDPESIAAIRKKLYQVQQDGLCGGEKRLTGAGTAGICELRLFAGSGTRIYFTENRGGILVLGISDKDGQDREIRKCIERRDESIQREQQARKSYPAHDSPRMEWKRNSDIMETTGCRPSFKGTRPQPEAGIRL